MTIGDEKVVAWLCSKVRNKWNLAGTEQTEETYTQTKVTTLRDEADALSALGYTVEPLRPHSAYAELAADRDLWMSMATFEGKVSASVLDDLHTTQAQLAALRGKVVGLAEHYDWLFQTEQDDEISGRHIADELRALAAADGATTGETK